MLERGRVLEGLRGVAWGRFGVEVAVLFGSLARRGRGRDVDLLVHSPRGLDRLSLALEVAAALGVDPGLVDVVPLRDAPCVIVVEAWRRGVVVYEARRGARLDTLLPAVKVCWDYSISVRRLRVVETAAKAMLRRWGTLGGAGKAGLNRFSDDR